VLLSNVADDTPRRRTISIDTARCTDARSDCPCGGDATVHAAQLGPAAPTPAAVDCPECGEPSSALPITTWGHCRVCRTADSRAKSPLRW